YWLTFFPAIVVLGLGMSISVAPLTTTVMGSVRKRQVGVASGVNNAVSRTAGLLAIAIFNIFVFNAFNLSLDRRLTQLNVPSQVRQALAAERINLAAAKVPDNISHELTNAIEKAIALSYVDSFRLIMFIAAALAVASAVIALLTIERRKKVL
ncbi:MAG: MFS transporter, partial [Rivularia sp. (in: cyanobacteria)]